jgi:hypothetical protein
MRPAHVALLVASLIGLAAGAWQARPSEFLSLFWIFSIFWASAAWCLMAAASAARVPLPWGIGALLALASSEYAMRGLDGLFYAVKPMYQIPIAAIGGMVAYGIVRLGADPK